MTNLKTHRNPVLQKKKADNAIADVDDISYSGRGLKFCLWQADRLKYRIGRVGWIVIIALRGRF